MNNLRAVVAFGVSVAVVLLGSVLAIEPASATTYEYDNINRLTRVDFENGNVIEYTYDQAGNRLTETVTGTGVEDPPVALFSATPTSGPAPLAVQFNDGSSGNPTSWLWEFGDGSTSSDPSPLHTYAVEGSYAVSLTVTNGVGAHTETKQDFISVVNPVDTSDTIALYLDVGAGAERYAQVNSGATFDLIVMTDTLNGSAAGEFVLAEVASLFPAVLKLSVTKINDTTFDMGDNDVGEYYMVYFGCVPPGPAEIVRIQYVDMSGVLPSDLVLDVRGFQPGDSQPSSFGGEPGYLDCNDVLQPLAGLEPELETGSGAVIPLGGAVINPTLPVVPHVSTSAPPVRQSMLGQNIPNPFNPRTMITYSLEAPGHTELTIYDVSGRRVKTLVSGFVEAGQQEAQWDGRDDSGKRVASGVYLYRLVAGEFRETKRMVLLK